MGGERVRLSVAVEGREQAAMETDDGPAHGSNGALRTPEALASLRTSLELSAKRRAQNTNAANLYDNALTDPRFGNLRQTPEFQKLITDLKPK